MGTREEEGSTTGACTTWRLKQDSTRRLTRSDDTVFSRLGYEWWKGSHKTDDV
jgi:hypothetical protein